MVGLKITGGFANDKMGLYYKIWFGHEDGTSEKVYLHPLSHCGKGLQCCGFGLTNRLRNGFSWLKINSNMRRQLYQTRVWRASADSSQRKVNKRCTGGTCSSLVEEAEGISCLNFQDDKTSFPWLAVSDEGRSHHSVFVWSLVMFPSNTGFFWCVFLLLEMP